jgi:predicted SnoaL-like aldol condensation-catalyzing enzyme
MEPEENIAVLRRAVDLINNGELEGGARLVTDSFKRHDLAAALPATQGGSGEVMDFLGTLVTAMPDLHFAFEDVFGAGDKVTARSSSALSPQTLRLASARSTSTDSRTASSRKSGSSGIGRRSIASWAFSELRGESI